eukprot:4341313-Amphidinium_carterae.1
MTSDGDSGNGSNVCLVTTCTCVGDAVWDGPTRMRTACWRGAHLSWEEGRTNDPARCSVKPPQWVAAEICFGAATTSEARFTKVPVMQTVSK